MLDWRDSGDLTSSPPGYQEVSEVTEGEGEALTDLPMLATLARPLASTSAWSSFTLLSLSFSCSSRLRHFLFLPSLSAFSVLRLAVRKSFSLFNSPSSSLTDFLSPSHC